MSAERQCGRWRWPREWGGPGDRPRDGDWAAQRAQLWRMRLKSTGDATSREKALHQACAIPLWRVIAVRHSAPQMREY